MVPFDFIFNMSFFMSFQMQDLWNLNELNQLNI